MFLVRIAADIAERQNDKGEARWPALLDGRNAWRGRSGCRAGTQRIDAHRSGDVFQRFLAEVDEGLLELITHLAPGVLGEADATRLGDTFQTSGDVDSVAHEVAVRFLDNIAEMNADAKCDAPFRRDIRIALGHVVLDLDRATRRIDHAVELRNEPVASALDHPAAVGGDHRIDQIAAQGSEPRERSLLVEAGEPAVADDIGDQDGSDLLRFRHGVPPDLAILL
jgi:hypothetical protein